MNIVEAAYDYDGADDTHISFKEGDKIEVLEEDESGWYLGRLQDGSEGYFPATYVQSINDNDNDETANTETGLIDANENTETAIISAKTGNPPPREQSDTNSVNDEYEDVDVNADADGDGYADTATAAATEKEKIQAYAIEPDQANVAVAQKERSLSLLKSDYREANTSNVDDSKLIDATSENYYSANVLNLKINPHSKSRFGLASYYMTYFTAFGSFMMGFACFSWHYGSTHNDWFADNNVTSPALCMLTGWYCIVTGIAVFIWNLLYGKQRTVTKIPLRSIGYFILSIVPFLTYVSVIVSVMWLVTFVYSALAWRYKEEYLVQDRKSELLQEWRDAKAYCSITFCKNWCHTIKQQSELKKYAFFAVYILFNVVYCAYQFGVYVDQVIKFNACAATVCADGYLGFSGVALREIADANGDGNVVTMLLPIAKFMGNLLDINCAFILLPVCRSFITKLYNISTDQRQSARCCNWILSFIPLDKSIELHIFMSMLISLGALVHTWGHFLHYSQVPQTYHAVFGNSVWISGALIVVVMQMIYCTSLAAVRHGKYELFWYTHHLFVVFFIACIFHGRQGFGPNYWKWMLVPGLLYICERSLREYNARKSVGVISICHMNNEKAKIFCIELEKVHHISTFYEGQYVFLKSPLISRWQWHPFTISSPPEQKTVTIHIRNMGPGSWSDRLQQFFEAMSPHKCYTELYHRDGQSLVPQSIGPDGKPLICIDGPISAPMQHLGEYLTCLCIGAGIGVTPMRAALQSIVYFRFKRGIGHCFPDCAYCCWIVNYKQLAAYRWMCRTLKEVEDELFDMRIKNKENMENKIIQIHIFVTSVPEENELESELELEDEEASDLAIWGTHFDDMLHDDMKDGVGAGKVQRNTNAPFDEMDIWKALKAPPADEEEANVIGDIIIHRGRPKWPELFEPIQKQHCGQKIGVMFCGPNVIAKDLQINCGKYSDLENDTRFVLHLENY